MNCLLSGHVKKSCYFFALLNVLIFFLFLDRVLRFTRRELVDLIFQDRAKNWDRKGENLQEFILLKSNCPPDQQNDLRKKVVDFFKNVKKKYNSACRRKNFLYNRHADWLQGTETFPLFTSFVSGPGRPSCSFSSASKRSKRRKVSHLREMGCAEGLSFAAAMNYRKERDVNKANVISSVSSATSSELQSYMGIVFSNYSPSTIIIFNL